MPMNTASDQVESSDGALYEDLENDSGTTAAQYSCLQVSTSGRQPAQTGRQPPGNSENYMNLVVQSVAHLIRQTFAFDFAIDGYITKYLDTVMKCQDYFGIELASVDVRRTVKF